MFDIFHSIVLELKALDSGEIKFYPGNNIHAFFLRAIRKFDEKISKKLHDQKREKPFTVSSFLGTEVDEPISIRAGKSYYIRLTILESNVFDIFTKSLLEKGVLQDVVNIGSIRFSIERVVFHNRFSNWAGKVSVEELFEKSLPSQKVLIRFYTPTLFKTGDLHFRYPDPVKIFTGLLNKFNSYSKIELDNSISKKFSEIVVSKKRTMKKRVYFKNFYLEGFVGDVEFLLPFNDGVLLKNINLLANFSFYAGVGYKTPMGLGQAKMIDING